MTGNLWQDWPVYVLSGVVVFFFIYVIIKGNQGDKEKKDAQTADCPAVGSGQSVILFLANSYEIQRQK